MEVEEGETFTQEKQIKMDLLMLRPPKKGKASLNGFVVRNTTTPAVETVLPTKKKIDLKDPLLKTKGVVDPPPFSVFAPLFLKVEEVDIKKEGKKTPKEGKNKIPKTILGRCKVNIE